MKRYVGCHRERPWFSPYELELECAVCEASIWVTLGANRAKTVLKADGYACFQCLDKNKSLIAQHDNRLSTQKVSGDG